MIVLVIASAMTMSMSTLVPISAIIIVTIVIVRIVICRIFTIDSLFNFHPLNCFLFFYNLRLNIDCVMNYVIFGMQKSLRNRHTVVVMVVISVVVTFAVGWEFNILSIVSEKRSFETPAPVREIVDTEFENFSFACSRLFIIQKTWKKVLKIWLIPLIYVNRKWWLIVTHSCSFFENFPVQIFSWPHQRLEGSCQFRNFPNFL